MRSYHIGAIITPMLGLQVMLTKSSVTSIDQIHIQCKLAHRGSVWLGECFIFYYYSIYWSDTSLGIPITSFKHTIITLKLHRSDQSRYLCRLPPANFCSKIGGVQVVELF